MTDKEKIIYYLDFKGISKNKFYLKTGFSVGFLESGKSLGVDKLKIILDNYHDLNAEWFFKEDAEMLKHDSTFEVNEAFPKYDRPKRVPLFELKSGISFISILYGEVAAQDFIQIPNLNKGDAAIYIWGKSMQPLLNPNDIVVYRKVDIKEHIFMLGELYLISLGEAENEVVLLRRIIKSEKGSEFLKLQAGNEEQEAIEIAVSQIKGLALISAIIQMIEMS